MTVAITNQETFIVCCCGREQLVSLNDVMSLLFTLSSFLPSLLPSRTVCTNWNDSIRKSVRPLSDCVVCGCTVSVYILMITDPSVFRLACSALSQGEGVEETTWRKLKTLVKVLTNIGLLSPAPSLLSGLGSYRTLPSWPDDCRLVARVQSCLIEGARHPAHDGICTATEPTTC